MSKVIRIAVAILCFSITGSLLAQNSPGAIFTTEGSCTGTNLNIFTSRQAVYLDGGPRRPGSAGLAPGEYYVKVTEPNGTLLGTSVGAPIERPAVVDAGTGEFLVCVHLWTVLIKASDGTEGYDLTSNNGGEYKVWASQNPAFPNNESKTDNFKIKETAPGQPDPVPARLIVRKYYDVDANDVYDDGIDTYLEGWEMTITDDDGVSIVRYTEVDVLVEAGDFTVDESMAPGWLPTGPVSRNVSVPEGGIGEVEFGNICLGAGGGHTLGFWSNKNGLKLVGADDLQMLRDLHLRDALGDDFDPMMASAFRTWLLSGSATNMAYMLSVQLSAMALNVHNGKVDGGAMIYAPGATSANALGFASVNDVMAEADASLATDGYTVLSGLIRTYQEALKNALDHANNNLNFVQSEPCAFAF
jgi:hypothetical protein